MIRVRTVFVDVVLAVSAVGGYLGTPDAPVFG